MVEHENIADKELIRAIRKGEVMFAGNKKLKIYGRLNCRSGMRMKRDNRVFFKSEAEAIELGFRACFHCMAISKKRVED